MYADVLNMKWEWYWRVDEKNDEADCGIFAQDRPGTAWAVFRCPRYMKQEEWERLASLVCEEHNDSLTKPR